MHSNAKPKQSRIYFQYSIKNHSIKRFALSARCSFCSSSDWFIALFSFVASYNVLNQIKTALKLKENVKVLQFHIGTKLAKSKFLPLANSLTYTQFALRICTTHGLRIITSVVVNSSLKLATI